MWVSTWTYANKRTGSEFILVGKANRYDLLSNDNDDVETFQKWLQWMWSYHGRGEMTKRLHQACEGQIDRLNRVVKTETLEVDMALVLTESGSTLFPDWGTRLKLILDEKPNSTVHKDYMDYYTPELARSVVSQEQEIFKRYYPEDWIRYT
jgi:hypothetical protein